MVPLLHCNARAFERSMPRSWIQHNKSNAGASFFIKSPPKGAYFPSCPLKAMLSHSFSEWQTSQLVSTTNVDSMIRRLEVSAKLIFVQEVLPEEELADGFYLDSRGQNEPLGPCQAFKLASG